MSEFASALLVILAGSLLVVVQATGFTRKESPLLLVGFAAHVVSAFFQVWFTRAMYGWGDLFGYTFTGEGLARLLRVDFAQFAPELLKAMFHQTPNLPFDVPAVGSSTGSMFVLATFLAYFTGGSFYTLGLTVAVFGYFGKVALYRAFRASFPEVLRRRLLIAITLIPSSIFWSSAMLKEAVAISGLGYVVWGLVRLRSTLSVVPVIQILLGATTVGLVKAYILFPVALAAAAWIYTDRTRASGRIFKPLPLAFAMLVALGGVTLLGRIFPQFALDNFADWAAYYQEIGPSMEGGSTYSFGDPSQSTLVGQLAFAPLALITALFRPFLFEARSAQVAINGLETGVLLIWWIRVFVSSGARAVVREIFRYPLLVFSLTFTLSFAVAVGLTTTNLGTLSRYRMPLVPFFWALLLVVDYVTAAQRRSTSTSATSSRPLPIPRLPRTDHAFRRPTAHQ